MNLPNKISLFRLLLVPIIFTLIIIYPYNPHIAYKGWISTLKIDNYTLPYSWLVAGFLFLIASLSDALDGYIARKYNMITTTGKFLDAIADKLLTNVVLIAFTCQSIIPIWITVIMLMRDLIIDVIRQILASKNVIVAANKWGKYKAAAQMLGLFILFFVNYQSFGGASHTTGEFNEYGFVNQIIMLPIYFATILSILSGFTYIFKNYKNLKNIGESKEVENE